MAFVEAAGEARGRKQRDRRRRFWRLPTGKVQDRVFPASPRLGDVLPRSSERFVADDGRGEMRGRGKRWWECDDATRVISPSRSAWRLLPTTITPASPAAAHLSLAIPEPGKPRSGCGSIGGATLTSNYLLSLHFIFSSVFDVRRPLLLARQRRATAYPKPREGPASTPFACDLDFAARNSISTPDWSTR